MTRVKSSSEQLRHSQEQVILKVFLENFNYFYSNWKNKNSCNSCSEKNNCWIKDQIKSDKLRYRYCLSQKIYEDRLNNAESIRSDFDPQEVCESLIQTIALWENRSATSFPKSSTLYNISNIFGCSINEFFSKDRSEFSIQSNNGIPEKERSFYNGTFFVYSKRPSTGEYNIGLLHITNKGKETIAYYRWRINDDKEKLNINQIEKQPEIFFRYSNDYVGDVQYVEGSLIINFRLIEASSCDMIHFFMPQLKIYHDSIRRIGGNPSTLKGGVGIISTLETDIGRVPLSYKICFFEVESNLETDTIEEKIKIILKQPSIKIKNDEARIFIEYLAQHDIK